MLFGQPVTLFGTELTFQEHDLAILCGKRYRPRAAIARMKLEIPDNCLKQNLTYLLSERELAGPLRADTLNGGPEPCFCVVKLKSKAIGAPKPRIGARSRRTAK